MKPLMAAKHAPMSSRSIVVGLNSSRTKENPIAGESSKAESYRRLTDARVR
jgi:hypothetical protein